MIVRARVRLLASTLLCCFISMGQGAVAAPPVVAGFERFGKTDAAAGQLLLGELNCVSCHRPPEASALAKQAPVLDAVGSRIRPGYFKTFLTDPQKAKPGSTMPHVFAGDPDAADKIEALAQYLASTGSPKQESSDAKAAAYGKETYHRIGCVACHGTRDAKGQTAKTTPSSMPLGDLKAKYTVASLAAFLSNPHAARPSGRMPMLLIVGDAKEKAKDARDLANFLIQGTKAAAPAGKGSTAYSYYEGSWTTLPDFAKLTPSATGFGPAFDLAAARRQTEYALKFDGVFRAPADGTYMFTTSSDDGSKLYVGGKQVVENDGIHPIQSTSGTVTLKKGSHAVTVTFFQGNGEDQLEVELEGPSIVRQPVGGFVAVTEADLDKVAQKAPPAVKDDGDAFEMKPELVARGKALFATEGCASCHQIQGIKDESKAPALAKLNSAGGCLSDAPRKGIPWFGLSAAQKTALAAAIEAPVPASNDPVHIIAKTLLAFNCYACHGRDQLGGPEGEFNKSFATTQEAMGDEARIPPLLDNVGGKMNLEYVKQILANGSHDRPYMNTRMPAFGLAAAAVPVAFAAVDRDKFPASPVPAFAESPAKIKGIGRHMVGKKAFGCVSCHTFAGNKAEGVQGMDMTLFTPRLQHDWFYTYMLDPQKIRPGTRMPSAFDKKGKSSLADILDGTAATQIDAMWLYLKDGKAANLPEGVKKQSIPLSPVKDAIVYRNFIQGAGSRAIGVGYPEKVNLAFDANDMRLAMIWQGSFIDAGRHWNGRGEGAEPPLGDNVVSLPAGATFAVLADVKAEWPKTSPKSQGVKFGGYRLTPDERPTFLYSVGDVKIEDFPNALVAGKEPGLRRTFELTAGKDVDNLYLRAAVGNKIESLGNGAYLVDGALRLKLTSPATPVIRTSAGKMELIVPVAFTNGKSRIVQEYRW